MYKVQTVKIKCEVIDTLGYIGFRTVTISLTPDSNDYAEDRLDTMADMSTLSNEIKIVNAALQLNIVAKSLGKQTEYEETYFDPKLELDHCTSDIACGD